MQPLRTAPRNSASGSRSVMTGAAAKKSGNALMRTSLSRICSHLCLDPHQVPDLGSRRRSGPIDLRPGAARVTLMAAIAARYRVRLSSAARISSAERNNQSRQHSRGADGEAQKMGEDKEGD